MKRTFIAIATACMLLGGAPLTAHAGPASDKLSQCLVKNVTSEDKQVITTWMFAIMSRHPSVAHMSKVTDEQVVQSNAAVGAVITRLMADDCPAEVRAAYKTEGQEAMSTAFKIVGEIAMVELMGHPSVNGSISEIVNYIDLNRLARVLQ